MNTPAPRTDRRLHPVVVVGAGTAGGAAAALLAHAGVPVLVLERHAEPINRPRAWVLSARTLEILRELDLVEKVTTLGTPGPFANHTVDTLLDAPPRGPIVDETLDVSPTGAAVCDQDVLERILTEYAVENGAQFEYGNAVIDLVDRGDTVEVHRDSGEPIAARYVLLAQGARAGLLPSVGITSRNRSETVFDEFYQVLFRSSELDELMADRSGRSFICPGDTIVFRRDLGRWQIQRLSHDFVDVDADVARAVGRPVAVEVLDRLSWRPAARLADSFRSGNVFLVGDAAHSMPPASGMGANLAIADAHNLAWKVAWTLDGRAGARLLDTYEAERRPVAEIIVDGSVSAMKGERRRFDLVTTQLGIGYPPHASSALVGDSVPVPITDPHDPSPVVGARLPHQWLPDGRSSLDLTSVTEFAAVVSTGSAATARTTLPINRLPWPAGTDATDGTSANEAWIVRPDGHVAARVPVDAVDTALAAILDRVP